MRPTCLAAAIRPRDIGTPAPGVVVLVRFAPWATGALHGMNLGERWVDAGPAWRTSRTALDPLVRACTWLDGVLRRPGPDRRVIRAWQAVIRDVAVGAEPLARSLDVSSRTLRRLMRARGGCSLRTARAVERFQAALRLLRSDLELPWASAAARAGYCDQSHFNRAFARWVGMSPVRFFGEGHHHLNDVFARRVVLQQECLTITSVGGPHLRAAAPIRPLRRDRRRSPRRR